MNLCCRDEIQRIKAGNPDITHREAFSAAAKNVRSKTKIFWGYMIFAFFTKLARVSYITYQKKKS